MDEEQMDEEQSAPQLQAEEDEELCRQMAEYANEHTTNMAGMTPQAAASGERIACRPLVNQSAMPTAPTTSDM